MKKYYQLQPKLDGKCHPVFVGRYGKPPVFVGKVIDFCDGSFLLTILYLMTSEGLTKGHKKIIGAVIFNNETNETSSSDGSVDLDIDDNDNYVLTVNNHKNGKTEIIERLNTIPDNITYVIVMKAAKVLKPFIEE